MHTVDQVLLELCCFLARLAFGAHPSSMLKDDRIILHDGKHEELLFLITVQLLQNIITNY